MKNTASLTGEAERAPAEIPTILQELIDLPPSIRPLQFGNPITGAQYLPVYRLFRRYLRRGMRVLDWGCGNGHFSYFLLRSGLEVEGFNLDIQGNPLGDHLRQRFGQRYAMTTGDSDDPVTLPYPDESFDLVTSIGVLEHVRETGGSEAASLREIHRVLRPGGLFIAAMLPKKYSLIEGLVRTLKLERHQHQFRYTGAELKALVNSTRLRLLALRTHGFLPRNSWNAPRLVDLAEKPIVGTAFNSLDRTMARMAAPIAQNFALVAQKPVSLQRPDGPSMRIIQAVADGRPGGGTSHVLHLAEALAAEGVEVHLVTERGSYAEERAAAAGIPVHGLPFFRDGRFAPLTWLSLARLVRTLEPDLIHAHGARVALPLTWCHGRAPLIYTVHGYHFTAKPNPVRQLAALAERRCSKVARSTIFVCSHDLEAARSLELLSDPSRGVLINNGVDLATLPARRNAEQLTLAFLGRLVPQKNPLVLADILDRLRDLPLDLVVIGDGELRAALALRLEQFGVADRVTFLGALPHEEALLALSRCHIMLLPSHWEGLPLAVLEAMGIGVLVVASRVGGLLEMIGNGETGWLVDGNDADAFARVLRRVLQDPEKLMQVVANAKQRVARRFSWETSKTAHITLYRRLTGL
jgi:glycosyltransferase involved in cell wall biosynthesis/SAM-dependent methyltransferase